MREWFQQLYVFVSRIQRKVDLGKKNGKKPASIKKALPETGGLTHSPKELRMGEFFQ